MNQPNEVEPLQFRLVHLMYFMAMIGSSIATFGIFGVYISLVLSFVWGAAFFHRTSPTFTLNVCVVIICTCGLLCLMPVGEARESARRMECIGNMKILGVAMLNYHDTYGTFPPAIIPDASGNPKHSWRVLLLPFLYEDALYAKYDFNEPWDGPNNIKLIDQIPNCYTCPSSELHLHGHNFCTSYVAVVGQNTASPGATGRSLSEFVDDKDKTLLLVECEEAHVPWLEPRDLQYAEAMNVLSGATPQTFEGHHVENYFYDQAQGRNYVTAYHSVHFIPYRMSQTNLAKLIQIDNGVPGFMGDRRNWSASKKRWKLGNCFRLTIFIVVMLLPFYCRWVLPFSKRAEEPEEQNSPASDMENV
ncbi:MAG: hypothetical protein COA78_32750 [Blastopirellula sp.]|nr:MAG: hypothetical protein COA78_32750 [Blastopirellula sp.]